MAHRQLLPAAARHSAKRTAKSIVQRAMRVTRSLQQQGRARRPARTQHATARWQSPTVILATARQRWQKALHANQSAMRATQCQARQHAHRWGSRRLQHAHPTRVMRQWPQRTAVLETALRHWPRDPHASPRATQATPCQAHRRARWASSRRLLVVQIRVMHQQRRRMAPRETALRRWLRDPHANQYAMGATLYLVKPHVQQAPSTLRHVWPMLVMHQPPLQTAPREIALQHWPRDPRASPPATQATPCQAPRSAWPGV